MTPKDLGRVCGACRWWIPDRPGTAGGGSCHYNPPSENGWPETWDNDWCGHFTSRVIEVDAPNFSSARPPIG